MRHNVPVTDAAIAAGVHLVDLGSYYPETLQQLDRHDGRRRGRLPDRARLRRRARPDQHPRPPRRRRAGRGRRVRLYSYITHPLWTSPGIVVTRFDASTGTSLVHEDGRLVERPSFGDDERIVFPEPYGAQPVHLVPHPEPVTLPRSIDVPNVVFKVGYPADETRRIRALLELGFDRDEPFERRRRRDLAAPLRRRLHRPPRHRPGRPQRQRQAGLRRWRARRRAADARLRLRRRADRPLRLVGDHRHGRGDRGRPGRPRRGRRRASRRRRPSIRGRSSTPSPSAGSPSASASCARPVGAQPSASALSSANRRSSSGTSARRLGRFTTIPSCVVRASTTIVSSSGEGFSSRCGTYGGT